MKKTNQLLTVICMFVASFGAQSQITLPYIQDFETALDTILTVSTDTAAGINELSYFNGGVNGRLRTNEGTSNSGTKSITMDGIADGVYDNNLATLTLNMSAYDTTYGAYLSFWYYDHGDEIDVEDRVWVRGDTSEVWLEIYNWIDNSAGVGGYLVEELNVTDLLKTNGQNYSNNFQIGFGQYDNWPSPSDGLSIDDVMLSSPACPKPYNLTFTDIDGTSGVLSWLADSASQWIVEYGPTGFAQGTGILDTTINNVDTLTGLSAATIYDFYILSNCGTTDTSIISSSSFISDCGLFSVTHSENFDGIAPVSPFSGLACWNIAGNSSVNVSLVSTTDDGVVIPSGNAIELNDGDLSAGDSAIIVTPAYSDLSTGQNRVRIKVHQEGGGAGDLLIGVMSDPNDANTFVLYETISSADISQTSFEEHIILFDNTTLIGANQHIAFMHGADPFEMYIDDYIYEMVPANDLAILTAVSPISDCILSSSESISVNIENQGSTSQSNFDVSYQINGGTAIIETVSSSIASGASLNYTFSNTADLSIYGDYSITITVLLTGDVDNTNDIQTYEVRNKNTPAPLTTTLEACPSVTLTASGDGMMNWYDALTGGNLLGEGDIVISNVTSSTNYYVEQVGYQGYNVGELDNTTGTGGLLPFQQGLIFDVYNDLFLHSVDIYTDSVGYVLLLLLDGSGALVDSATFQISNIGINKLNLNFTIPAGNDYVLIHDVAGTNVGSAGMFRTSSGANYPYLIPDLISIKDNTFGDLGYYYYYYNWDVRNLDCASERVSVPVLICGGNGNNENLNSSIKLFPNPTKGSVNIELVKIESNTLVELISITGSVMKSINLNSTLTTINVSDLPSGLYTVKVSNIDGIGYQKLIIE